jgi:hypothetical protein
MVMSLTPEQRAIANRLGDLSREYEAKLRANQIAQAEARQRVLNAAGELQIAVDRNMELLDIFRRHNDAFAEFIDTL